MSMGVSGSSGAQKGVNANINVTPLCDVMLVLLIIFMVVTPLLQKGVDVKLPPAEYATDHPDNEETVNVAIKLDRTIYLDKIPVPESEIVIKIAEKFEGRIERIIFLKADEGLEYGEVLRIMDLVRQGGVEEVAIITETKTES